MTEQASQKKSVQAKYAKQNLAESSRDSGRTLKPNNLGEGATSRKVAALLLTRVLDDKRNFAGLTDLENGLDVFRSLPDKDRILSKSIARTVLARKGQIDTALRRVLDRPVPKRARHLQHTLSCAAAQILFMDVPDSAAVNIAVDLIDREPRSKRFKSLANAVLRNISRQKETLLPKIQSDKLNTPNWMYNRWKDGYGHVAARAIATHHAKCHAQKIAMDLTAKGDPNALAARIDDAMVMDNGSIRLPNAVDVTQLPGFLEGDFWVQDAAASLPAKILKPKPDEDIVDLCAAPGGKTAQLAAAGANIFALEASAIRLKRLNENLKRLGFQQRVSTICADLLEWQPQKLFDAVLLDAPCSSTGTIRRHPDILWTKTPKDVESLADLQLQFALRASQFLKPGGRLVFSNCSLDPLEGEILYERLLAQDISLKPDPIIANEVPGYEHATHSKGWLRCLPCYGPTGWGTSNEGYDMGGDGFFVGRFLKSS